MRLLPVLCLLAALFTGLLPSLRAQTEAEVYGKVLTLSRLPIPGGRIWATDNGRQYQAVSDSSGRYRIQLPPGDYTFTASALGYDTLQQDLNLHAGERQRLNFALEYISTDTINVTDQQDPTDKSNINAPFMQELAIKRQDIQRGPMPVRSVEKIVSQLAGGTTSEFSSQYRVRGGNFDENLIYINGVEVYRPQLVRSGRQEGLPLTNYNMTSRISYSPGGFQAIYGDKMSSSLTLNYRTPERFATNAELGFITQSVTTEGYVEGKGDTSVGSRPGRFTYLIGARRMSLSFLLNTLDESGEYKPRSWDAQSFLTYTPPRKHSLVKTRRNEDGSLDTIYRPSVPWKFSLLSIVQRNDYRFIPESRETTFGTIQQALRLFVGFSGEDNFEYTTTQNALVAHHKPSLRLDLTFIASHFRSDEDELFTTEGAYRLGDVSTNLGNDDFGDVVSSRGIGSQLESARNFLTIDAAYTALRGEWKLDKNFYDYRGDDYVKHRLWFGLRQQGEWITDRLNEWNAEDSADFVTIRERIRGETNLQSARTMGYLQYGWRFSKTMNAIAGVRANYWSLNEELLVSPRMQLAWDPSKRDSSKNYLFRFAAGVYQQPPFYRELRNLDGRINKDQEAQRSYHFILGNDYVFRMWGRPFKLSTEVYYKYLDNLVPFEFDNVRLRYYAFEEARGYAAGLDAKLNGQFIDGVDSWFRLSVLKTEENVEGDGQGFVRRPTDQRVTASLFFQDHIPRMKTLKVHVNMITGTGLPFGPPGVLENRAVFQQPLYNRVDIGLSYLLSFRGRQERQGAFGLRSLWVSLEVFNLLQRANTISHDFISDTFGNRFAIPNRLSARLVNGRVVLKF